MSERAIFTRTGPDHFTPTNHVEVRSRWAARHLQGGAVVALAALALETRFHRDDFMPARLTVDLFKSARTVPTTTRVEMVRDGRRVRISMCTVEQDGVPVAQATLVQYLRTEPPPGAEWTPEPPVIEAPTGERLVYLQSSGAGWTSDVAEHQNSHRKLVAIRGLDVVAGEPNTPFVDVASIADVTSLATNLGSAGLGYINGDVTLALSRLPRGRVLYFHAQTHSACDGISVGSATLLDDSGAFGTSLVTALSNASAQIDFADPLPSDS